MDVAGIEHVVEEAKQHFVGVEFEDGYLGHDIVVESECVVLRFREKHGYELFGVRFPLPVLPREGVMYRGMRMRTARDWILDLRLVLMEEIGTGALFHSNRIPRPGWTELSLSFSDPWSIEDSTELSEWTVVPEGLLPKMSRVPRNSGLGRVMFRLRSLRLGMCRWCRR